MTSYSQSLASWYYWWTAQPPPSTDLYRRHPSSMVVEITEINVQNLPSSASSVRISAGHRGDSGVQSAEIAPGQSLNWSESEFRQQKLAVRPSSTLYLNFFLGTTCVFEIEVAFAEVIAGFSSDLKTNACIYIAKDCQANPVELQVKLVIHERPQILPYNSLSSPADDDNSPIFQLSTLFKTYITLERTYNARRRVHPLVKAFISPTLSQIWSSNLQRMQNSPPSKSDPSHWWENRRSRPRTAPRPLLEIVLGMNDLMSSLLRRSYTISQENQELLNQVFAELCRCTALLEEADEVYENVCIASKGEEYRKRQERLFILLYRITRLLYGEGCPDDSTDMMMAVGDLLDRVCKEDRAHPDLSSPSSQLERNKRPFTTTLASARGYARDQVWQGIVAVLNETQYATLRDTCRRALLRLMPTSGQLAPELWAGDDLYLGGLCLRGNDAYVWQCAAEDKAQVAFKESEILIKHLEAPEARQRMILAFITWKYLNHPRLLPFLGVQDIYVSKDNTYTPYIVSPWIEWDKKFAHRNVKSKLRNATFRRRCITEIVEGMIYLHRMGVVHGSLRVANIFMGEDEHILIADYGTWHFANGVKGKERWTAPELWDRIAAHRLAPVIQTMQSDIWSFACLCTELYTGHIPWGDKLEDSEVEDSIRLRSRYPPRPDDMEDEIWEILKRCWVRDPARRPDFVTIGRWLAEGMSDDA